MFLCCLDFGVWIWIVKLNFFLFLLFKFFPHLSSLSFFLFLHVASFLYLLFLVMLCLMLPQATTSSPHFVALLHSILAASSHYLVVASHYLTTLSHCFIVLLPSFVALLLCLATIVRCLATSKYILNSGAAPFVAWLAYCLTPHYLIALLFHCLVLVGIFILLPLLQGGACSLEKRTI